MLRGILAILGVFFAGLIVWAMMTGDFGAAGTWLTSDPWGIVTLFDLYFGFLIIAIIIALVERGWHAVFWIAPIPFLGNVWTVVWVIWRLPQIKALLSREYDAQS